MCDKCRENPNYEAVVTKPRTVTMNAGELVLVRDALRAYLTATAGAIGSSLWQTVPDELRPQWIIAIREAEALSDRLLDMMREVAAELHDEAAPEDDAKTRALAIDALLNSLRGGAQ